LHAKLIWLGWDFLGGRPYMQGMSMTGTGNYRVFWYCVLAAGLGLGTVPLFMHGMAFGPLEMLGGAFLAIVSLVYLRKPRRIRLPYRRTLS